MSPAISPFQLVFGRKPRMSPRDITFPNRIVPPPVRPEQHAPYVADLTRKLQSLRLAALDKQLERKQQLRANHDRNRKASSTKSPQRGDIVYVYTPTTTAQKLTLQWSPPCHLVLRTNHNTCIVRPLTSTTGRGGKFPQDVTRNIASVKVAALRPADFWIGARVLRKFKQAWFLGTVIDITEDNGHTLYHIDYDDCGQEDIDKGELYDGVVYHPRLEQSLFKDTQLPAINQTIMFALHNGPRFGKIVEINPMSGKPLSVMLWKPSNKSKTILTARFKPTQHLETGPEIVQITPAQIKTHVTFSPEGLLNSKSRDKVRHLMTRKQRAPHPTKRRVGPKTAEKAEPFRNKPPLTVERKPAQATTPKPHHRYPIRSRRKTSKP